MGAWNSRPRRLNHTFSRTNTPCMLGLHDGERALMPCGHAITPGSLYEYCSNELKRGKAEIMCPYPVANGSRCNRVWATESLKSIACLDSSEQVTVDKMLKQNRGEIKPCPRCSQWTTRYYATKQVSCQFCGTSLCWDCTNYWRGGNNAHNCGNVGCDSKGELQAVLRNCPNTIINGVTCPARRACPSCGSIFEHIKNCPNMVCTHCKKTFCFICLRVDVQYGHKPCELALRQA
ncbi:hypothetical protein ScPMuIL_002462 [Solemya velum]